MSDSSAEADASPVSCRFSRVQSARRCSRGEWSCGCIWCHTRGRCPTRSAVPAFDVRMAARHWHKRRGGEPFCFRAAWPSPSGELSTPAPFPSLWRPAEGHSPSLNQNVLQGGTKARRFLQPYQGFMFRIRTALPCPVHCRSSPRAEIAVWGGWKLTLLSCLPVLLLRPAVHAEEGPAEPHDKAARRAKAPRGKGSGRQRGSERELSCAQAWPREWHPLSCLALFSEAGSYRAAGNSFFGYRSSPRHFLG